MLKQQTLALLVLLAACGDDTTSTSLASGDTTGDTTTATTSSSSATTTVGPTTPGTTATEGSGDASSSATSSNTTDATTVDPSTTTTTTASSSTDTSAGSTGGPGACGVPGEIVDATLEHVGQPPACGTLEFTGQRISGMKGPNWMLDGCPCGADCFQPDPWTFSLTIPTEWLPDLPDCPRIVVDRQMGFGGCEFAAVSIWDDMQMGAPAFFHAGHGFAATTAAQKELTLAEQLVATCPCEGCCGDAQLWSIDFDLLGMKANLAEGQQTVLGKYGVINFESHTSGFCDAPLDAHWAALATP